MEKQSRTVGALDYYGKAQKENKKPNPVNLRGYGNEMSTNVGLSAAITGYARMYMYQYRIKSYYHDTDSIFMDEPLKAKEISQTELGKFKLVAKVTCAVFLGPKNYGYREAGGRDTIKMAGYSKTKVTLEEMALSLKNRGYVRKMHSEILEKSLRTQTISRITRMVMKPGEMKSRIQICLKIIRENPEFISDFSQIEALEKYQFSEAEQHYLKTALEGVVK